MRIIEDLPVGLQQRVEILKALYRGADILILDEPTGVLTPPEADHLFDILRQLKAQGKTIVLITHKLREIMAITDNVSVHAPGQMVATRKTSETSVEELAEADGRAPCAAAGAKRAAQPGEVKLPVENLTVRDKRGVTMVERRVVRRARRRNRRHCRCRRQRPVGTDRGDFRHPPAVSGRVTARRQADRRHRHGPTRRTAAAGLAHVPEDRHYVGLVLPFEESENSILGYHGPRISQGSVPRHRRDPRRRQERSSNSISGRRTAG